MWEHSYSMFSVGFKQRRLITTKFQPNRPANSNRMCFDFTLEQTHKLICRKLNRIRYFPCPRPCRFVGQVCADVNFQYTRPYTSRFPINSLRKMQTALMTRHLKAAIWFVAESFPSQKSLCACLKLRLKWNRIQFSSIRRPVQSPRSLQDESYICEEN